MKVLLAMSGGVDSSVAAALLKRQGHEVVGVFMRLGTVGETLDELTPGDVAACAADGRPGADGAKVHHQGCCSVSDAADARLVAARLDIPFYVVNFKKEFGRIIDYFDREYAAGRTPNPCVRCNDWLKFGKLHEYAGQIGATHVASGHYARVEGDPAGAGDWRLLRGLDASKDQSYVLFGMPRARLERTLFPIGGLRKAEVRALAAEVGLDVAQKPDSQEICFVPGRDYAGFLEGRAGGQVAERVRTHAAGAVLDEQGNPLGTHGGQHRFTLGQRKGLGVASDRPLYVIAKDARTNTVTLGPRERLLVRSCVAGEANWLAEEPAAGTWRACFAKYRYNTAAARARVRVIEAPEGAHAAPTPSGRVGRFEVEFDEAQEAVTPGQAIVLYDAGEPDWVLGGGWVEGER